jgi:general secretion pathway protein M
MSVSPRPKGRCVLVWLILVGAPLLLLFAVGAPWASRLATLNETIADREDQLSRFQRLIRSMPQLRSELERTRNDEAFQAFYFKAATQALAGAQLQTRIQEIVNSASGRLISIQILPEEKQDGPPRIQVRTQVQGSTETLLDVLYQLEQARPFLFVERLSIRSSARAVTTPGGDVVRRATPPAASSGGELTLRLDIFGFVLGGES